MKKINLIRMLQEGSSIMKKARGLLLLCTLLLMNVHAWASDPHFHLTGTAPTGGWSNSATEWKLSSPASSALGNGTIFNEYCTYTWLSEGDYFGLNNGSKRYSRNDYYDVEIKEGDGSGVYGYPADASHTDKSFHYVGATGLVRINAAQTGSGNSYGQQGEWYPYIWVEESLETAILTGSKIMFYFGIADSWNTNWFYLSKEGDQNSNKSYKAYYSTATKLYTRIAVAYVDANTAYYIANAQTSGTCIKMSDNAVAGYLYSLNSDGGNHISVNTGNVPHFATTSVTKAKGTEASTIAATAANSIFGNAYTYHYYYTTDGGSTFTKFDPSDISGLASGTYTVYALGWDGHILVKSDNSVTLKITVPITLNANGGVDGAVTSVNAVNGDLASTGNIAGGSLPTKTNYVFTGFYTSGGTQVINANGEWISNVSGYTDADGKWTCTAGSTLYAHWEDQWNLKGSWDSWAAYKGMPNVSSNTYQVTLSLSASTTYDLKVVKRTRGSSDVYYGKASTTFTRSSLTSAKNLVTTDGDTYNMHITTDVAGDYTFTFVYDASASNMKVLVKYPCATAGKILYKFEVKSGLSSGNVCSTANTDIDINSENWLSVMAGGTLTANVTNTNRIQYASPAFKFANGEGGVLRVDLDCALQTGDVIRYINSATGSDYNAYVRHTSSSTTTNQLTLASNNPTQGEIEVPAAFNGESTIYIVRGANNGALISQVEIIRPYKVVCKASSNSGKVDAKDSVIYYKLSGESAITLPHATKSGSRFKGWYTASSGGSLASNPYTATASVTLHAQFEDCPSDGTVYKFQVKTGLTNGTKTAGDLNVGNFLSTLDGGTAVMTGTHAQIINTNAIDFKDNGDYITVDLDCALQTGDTIITTISGSKSGIKITSTSSTTSLQNISYGTKVKTIVPSGLNNYKTFRLYRQDSNAGGISYFEIKRPAHYTITHDLSHVTTSSPEEVIHKAGYTATYTADDGYELPATISVTRGVTDITTNCTWSAGTVTIPAADCIGDITISVTGEEVSCSATTPGAISKGAASGGTGTITLTAAGSPASNNTWYWQSASDGTATNLGSGATKDVSAAGTYYIRSYCSTGSGCWSDAKSVTVAAADLLTSISPTLSYPSTVTVGGSTISPTLEGNSGSGSVSYALNSVSPSGSLTIDSETGVVTGVTASGTATVTATISANGNYAGGSATSSTITVRATPSVSSFTPASGSTIKTGTTITVAGSSSSTVYCLWASSSKTASQIQEGTAGTSGAATVTSAGIASANGTTLYAVATEGGATSSVSSASYTIDDTAPTFVSSVPANSATGVNTSGTIVLTFSEALGSVDGSKFTLTNATKGAVAIDGSDNTKVNIAYSGASYSTTVTLATAAGAVADAAGNTSAALSSISFTTKAAPSCSGDPSALTSNELYTIDEMVSNCSETAISSTTSDGTGIYQYGLSNNGKFYVVGTTNGDNSSTGTVEMKKQGAGTITVKGETFTYISWFKGAGSTSCRSIKFVTPSAGTLIIYGKVSSKKGNIELKQGSSSAVDVMANSKNASDTVHVNITAGATCYLWADGASAALYGIYFDKVPELSSSDPANGDTDVPVSGTIVLTFDESITDVDDDKFSLSTGSISAVAVDGTDDTKVNITYSGLPGSTEVTLSVAAGAVTDAAGNTSAALSDIVFTTESVGYAITNGSPSGGTITIKDDEDNDITSAAEDATVYITATPSTGYGFTSWNVTKTSGGASVTLNTDDDSDNKTRNFTMPGEAVTVNATFTAINYTITHSAASNGSYTIQVASEDAVSTNTTANYNQTITLAATPDSHYKLQAWNVTKTSSGDAVSMATANTFVMPAEAVTIAPTFGRVYTVSFEKNGASSATPSPVEQSTIGGTVTMPSAPTYTGYTFQGWMIGDDIYAAGDATYVPTADVKAWAIWKETCAGGGSAVLFSQNFNSATTSSAVYTATTLNSESSHNLFGSTAASQFTSFGMVKKDKVGYASNTSVTVNSTSYNYTGKFGVRAANTSGTYSLMKTTDFAATAPTAIKIEMKMKFAQGNSATDYSLSFAVGDGFTDGTCPAASLVHSGFSLYNNSNADICGYLTKTAITGQTKLAQSEAVVTWVINNTGSSLTYTGPDSKSHTVDNDKFDVWQGTTLHATGTASTASKDLQELYIGDPNGKNHEFYLDSIVVTNLNASSCHYVTYDGNGATSGSVNDKKAYTAGDNSALVLSSNFHREDCYEVSCWNTKADGSGTDYQEGEYITVNENITLYAIWRIIIDENVTNLDDYETPQYKDVRVTNGAMLTINKDVTVRNMLVETGSTLKIDQKDKDNGATLTVNSLSLAGGYGTVNNAIKYDMPRVYIDSKSTLTKTSSTVNFDIAVTNQYHPIAVPFRVKVKDVNYAKKSLKDIATYLTNYAIRTYDGKSRAQGGTGSSNWATVYRAELVDEELVDTYLEPGRGYILAAMRGYGDAFAVIRFPMEVDNAWTAAGEKGVATISAVETTKNAVSVTAWEKGGGATTPKKDKGWNILGVPYMSCFASSQAGHDQDDPYVLGKFNFSDGTYSDEEHAYVSVPTHDFSEYVQEKVEDAVLLPGWCFFVQFDKTGTLTFATAGERQSSTLPIYAPKRERENMPIVETGIILSGNEASDKTTIIVSDRYNAAEYEINADLEKLFGDNSYTLATYSLSGETRLAYNAMSNADAANIIPIGYRAPADGEYTFSINPRYAESGAFESVNLIDYETGITTDLLMSSYTFSTERTQNDARFALNVVKQKETPTDIELVGGEGLDVNAPRKLLLDGRMFIILDGKMFDAQGKRVK